MKKNEYKKAQKEVKQIFKDANIPLPQNAEIEITDFGLNEFRKTGLGLYVKVNEPEYCSKWMVLLPGQTCPFHYHKKKKETFIVMKGIVKLSTEAEEITLKPGATYTLSKNTYHTFTSKNGAIVEEVSTFDSNADNYFKDKRIIRDTPVE
jgi:D-lyxose ketol-isomerase